VGILAAIRGDRARRSLVVLASVVTVLFLALHLSYSLAANRLILSILPLLAAVMGLPCAGGGSWPWLRASAFVLVAATLLIETMSPPGFYAPPNLPVSDVAALEKIADTVEPNAAIMAHTNPFSFARELRRGADRVWVPLRLDPHQTTIAVGHLAPVCRDASAGGWIERPVMEPFGRKTARAMVEGVERLCRQGRPIYLSEQLRHYVDFVHKLERTLRRSFKLTRVVAARPYVLYRVECSVVDGVVQLRRRARPAAP
jgi:hypothetical protein